MTNNSEYNLILALTHPCLKLLYALKFNSCLVLFNINELNLYSCSLWKWCQTILISAVYLKFKFGLKKLDPSNSTGVFQRGYLLRYTRAQNVWSGWPVYEVKCLCSRGQD